MSAVEEWLPVVGYEGYYEVSDHGRVRSLDRTDSLGRLQRGRVLRQGVRKKTGHRLVSLWRENVGHSRDVHRLVGEAFFGPLPHGFETRHLNGDPSNNAVTNLQYGTKSENNLDRVAHGTHHNASKVACIRGHRLEEPNLRPAARRLGYRQCRACGWEHARHHAAGEPFDTARADHNYERILKGA